MEDSAKFRPVDWLEREEQLLAPYAMRTRNSKGRQHPENAHDYRSLYQRDRDRIIHSTAFRRLMYKTQVLVIQASDHHRTRLTHTLEVTQISRTIARQLGLNEDLTEAIALMHDLGHPPFGHSGEEVLNECMKNFGGFEHNHHGLRIVEELEYRYPDFPGLNLSWEVLEAQAMHSKRPDYPEIRRYLNSGKPILEAQLVDVADSLAYDTHDVDDALSVGLLTFDELNEVTFWRKAVERVRERHSNLSPLNFQPTVVRTLIDWQVSDLLEQTGKNFQEHKIRSVEDVRACKDLLISPSSELLEMKSELEAFLKRKVYHNYRVMRMVHKGQRILQLLFDEYCKHWEQLPERYLIRAKQSSLQRSVCDYLAGMTDRFAQDEYLRLFQPYISV